MNKPIIIPQKPFPGFKWQWASVTPTESLNDPVVLLGVLFRMKKLEGKFKYSSTEFNHELEELSHDLRDSVGVDLANRGGNRNLIRNSGQYWKALNLIPRQTRGMITLTEFGRKVANREISQTEFSALTILSLKLPNPAIQTADVCTQWEEAGIILYPLKLILSISYHTKYLTVDELIHIVIPLSGTRNCSVKRYVECILDYRQNELAIQQWPDCCMEANDKRMAREFLLFLSNYGYMNLVKRQNNAADEYHFNFDLQDEILTLLHGVALSPTFESKLTMLHTMDVVPNVERKRMQTVRMRPHQAQFRREVLHAYKRCIITNVTMPEVLEAAHIKPYKYNGADTVENGFAMRTDIHLLFDTGHLRIDENGKVELSQRARMDYGALIPPQIVIPQFIDRENLRWRWRNYDGM